MRTLAGAAQCPRTSGAVVGVSTTEAVVRVVLAVRLGLRGVGPKTVAAKQAAILQMQATRAARHTMGTRQREKIKGVVAAASSDVAASTRPDAREVLHSVPEVTHGHELIVE